MRSDVIVISSIGAQNPAQMRLTQDDEMVHALAPDRPDQPFGKAILPRRGPRGGLVSDAHGGHPSCDVDPDQVSAVQTDDDERIEQVEANGRDNEQIHGSNVRRVVPQKGAPSLTWRPASLDHVFGDARLRALKPKLEEFAVDARRSPQWVLDAHSPDQCTEVRLNLRPPSP